MSWESLDLVQRNWAWAAAGAAALAGLVVLLVRLLRPSAEELERRRRERVNSAGRLTRGFVTEVGEWNNGAQKQPSLLIHYRYELSGIEYLAAQDVTTLADALGPKPESLIGDATVKYDRARPSNSIVVCENWSGLKRPC